MTRPYAEVIGDPIAHSKSPLIHNFWLSKLGIDAEYRACHVRPDELEDYFTRRRGDAEWRGCNVTMPHKREALNAVDEVGQFVDDATNTIVASAGKLIAQNTDIAGILEPLNKIIDEQGISDDPFHPEVLRAQIIGAGGAASSAIDAMYVANFITMDIFSRSIESARQAAAAKMQSRKSAFGLDCLRPWPSGITDPFYGRTTRFLIINASPMGMVGKPDIPIHLSEYPKGTIVFDMVYAPVETQLLKAAREHGFNCIDGLQMLVGQASAAFALLFGQPAPREHDAELRALLTA